MQGKNDTNGKERCKAWGGVLFCCPNEFRHFLIIGINMHYNNSTARRCRVVEEIGKIYRYKI